MQQYENVFFFIARVDVVLLSGDIANMAMDPLASQKEVSRHLKDMDEMVAAIAEINPNLYYIPGNVRYSHRFQIVLCTFRTAPHPLPTVQNTSLHQCTL